MVVNTFSSLGENEDDMDDRRSNVSDDDPKIEGAGELKNLRPEERVPWMERKMHEQSTLVSDLVGCKASEKRVEAERSKLRQYELMRFKEFRRSMIEKIRRRKDTGNKGERRPRVSIESGRCTLRTALKQEASLIMMPAMVKKPSTKDLRAKAFASAQPTNFTRFSIPRLVSSRRMVQSRSRRAFSRLDFDERKLYNHGRLGMNVTYIRACVRLNVKGSWEDLQLVITRCTVDDIQKIVNKLKTFFEEQLKSSKMVWGIQEDSSAAANSKEQPGSGVALRQKLIIRLGSQDAKRTAPNNPVEMPNMSAENMATVCRVQQNRNTVMRQNASISTSLDYLIGDVLKQIGAASYSEGAPTSSRGQHSVLELFQFPALEAVLVTDQMNECDVVEFDEDERPEVHSTFVCDFLDAVCVQTDFNAQVSFLPELLKSYMQVSAMATENNRGEIVYRKSETQASAGGRA
ncbi:hypothetical protein TELCIR_14066 [Teladorsagia circumcincta]|uniref:Bridge-like lipid transfer protein family member 1 C-terminal domain-containing protein n=1 Tax=Teladorsagia circumcincta TaxID=45464 RepID=A0A2G9U216_TELCI|nr:hypothetical protein TELCIR_14066 [Teladorsagia circumcincta]